MIFAPNCNCRGLLAVPTPPFALTCVLTLPKAGFVMSVVGGPRITVLNMLKASARSSMRRPSPQNGNWRKIDVSRFQNEGDRNASRPLFPKVYWAGTAKALVLKMQLTLPTRLPFGQDPLLGSPTRFALSYCAHETLPV